MATGINASFGTPTSRRYHRAIAQGSGLKVQLREDDLPKVLRSSPTSCHQLQKEEVRPHKPATTKEEDKVVVERMVRRVAMEAMSTLMLGSSD
jgi:hypothetical protein